MVVCMVLRWFRPVGLLPTGSSNFTLSPGGGEGGGGREGQQTKEIFFQFLASQPKTIHCNCLPKTFLLFFVVVKNSRNYLTALRIRIQEGSVYFLGTMHGSARGSDLVFGIPM